MEEKDLETKIISTKDENGEVHNFELLDIVEVEGKEYGLLVHVDEESECSCGSESEEECECEEEVVIMKLIKNGDDYSFETIEDDEEFNKIVSFIETECDLEELTEE